MTPKIILGACAVAACAAPAESWAQEAATVVVTAKRAHRVSKGATGLPMEVKDTPQTISTLDQEEMADFGVSGSNDALSLGTGINVEKYETNRVALNARGFEVQLTQIDGLGMSNDWGVVTGQLDTFLFERVELIRGANGLLTGVGNASGTVNYVRKRPKNTDSGLAVLTLGSYDRRRAAVDVNRVLTQDGAWAGRLVVAHEDKHSWLRSLHDQRTSVYAVVDGQIGDNGVLTLGFTHLQARQHAPMWGSLTLNHLDGRQAAFDPGTSTSQDWTYWNTGSQSAFVEYVHRLGADWEVKLTANRRLGDEKTKLLYAYAPAGGLEADGSGLIGWPYRSVSDMRNTVLDVNVSGQFPAFGRRHSLIAGLSHSRQKAAADIFPGNSNMFLPLPAQPFPGNVYPEPTWGAREPSTRGEQQLTRLYLATRLALSEPMKLVLGLNAIKLEREGASIYGSAALVNNYPKTEKVSPYAGLTYDITRDVLGYVSYSDIFQNQDQTDITGAYLAPMKGVNAEAGIKAEWLDKQLLTTFALFSAEQQGLATYAGMTPGGQYYYVGKDVRSRGVELEATGRLNKDARLTLGLTRMKLTGPDGQDIYEWIPRTTVNLRFDTRLPLLPALKFGVAARWQSEVAKQGVATQDAYLVANAFASYDINDAARVRLNVNNLFDKRYVGGLAYGAIYGAPRHGSLGFEYRL